jgi:hypothetical protein
MSERDANATRTAEPWLDKRDLAEHLSCSLRSIQTALAEGMPHAIIFGRCEFRVSQVEPWLEAHGYLVRRDTLEADIERPGGAGTPRAMDTRRKPDASQKA